MAAQRAKSLLIAIAKESGVSIIGSAPSTSNFAFTSGCCMILTKAVFSFLMMNGEVPEGAITPYQEDTLKPDTPDSLRVGIDCAPEIRLSDVTAIAYNCPDFINGPAVAIAVTIMGTCPETTSVIA